MQENELQRTLQVGVAPQKTKTHPLDKVTAKNYRVPDNERHLYHFKQEVISSDNQMNRLSRPEIQKYGVKTFATLMAKHLTLQKYTIEVLYDPTDYLKEQDELRSKMAQARKMAKNTPAPNADEIKQSIMAELGLTAEDIKMIKEAKAEAEKGKK